MLALYKVATLIIGEGEPLTSVVEQDFLLSRIEFFPTVEHERSRSPGDVEQHIAFGLQYPDQDLLPFDGRHVILGNGEIYLQMIELAVSEFALLFFSFFIY